MPLISDRPLIQMWLTKKNPRNVFIKDGEGFGLIRKKEVLRQKPQVSLYSIDYGRLNICSSFYVLDEVLQVCLQFLVVICI